MSRIAPVLAALALACAGRFDASKYPTPDSLYEAALAAYRRGECAKAQPGFQALQFELPATDQRQAEARYYVAECMMQDGQYLEAARLFRQVSDDHLRHELAPDALLRAGDAYAELWRNPELDPTYGETARSTYRELLGRYPGSTAAERAQLRLVALDEMFAEKAFKAGRFYQRLRAYDSAIIYYKDVLANYPQSEYAPQALVRLVETYERIGYREEQREMCRYLRQYYPDALTEADACPEGAASP